jgi:hypothetical protein
VRTSPFSISSRLSSVLRRRQNAAARKSKSSRVDLHPLPRMGRVGGTTWKEREERVKELERKMIELETKKNDAAEERARLGEIVEEVAKARRSLQLPKGVAINGNGSGLESVGSSRPETPLSTASPSEIPQTVVEGSADAQLLLSNKPIQQP